MSVSAARVALVVFLIGALGVWLIKPIGNACPDIGQLPAGSRSSSAPSFTPPLTRTCTYTAGGIEAHQRYVPIVDWIVLGVLAGVVGLGVALLGGSGPQSAAGRKAEVDGPPDWLAEPRPPPPARPPAPAPHHAPAPRAAPATRATPATRAKRVPRPAPAPPAPLPDGESEAASRAAQRELERRERARRRGR